MGPPKGLSSPRSGGSGRPRSGPAQNISGNSYIGRYSKGQSNIGGPIYLLVGLLCKRLCYSHLFRIDAWCFLPSIQSRLFLYCALLMHSPRTFWRQRYPVETNHTQRQQQSAQKKSQYAFIYFSSMLMVKI